MDPNDPFNSLTKACLISPADESAKRACSSFFGWSDSDSDYRNPLDPDYRNPFDPDCIRILSPPASSEEEDVFQTPSESRSTPTASSSANQMVRKSAVSERDAEETRVSKKLKSFDFESLFVVLQKSPGKSDADTDSEVLLERLGNEHLAPGGAPESEVQNPTATGILEGKRVDDGPSISSASPNRNRILEVLLQLEKNEKEDTSLYGLSLLEVAEAKWGPFSERDIGNKNI